MYNFIYLTILLHNFALLNLERRFIRVKSLLSDQQKFNNKTRISSNNEQFQ